MVVEVANGEVAVRSDALTSPVRLVAGRRLQFDSAASRAVVSGIESQSVGEWREGRLTYDSAPLQLVASDLARYAGADLVVPDALAQRHFSGTLFIGDGDSAIRDLAQLMELERASRRRRLSPGARRLTLPTAGSRSRARTLPKAIAELSREEGISIGAEGSLPQVRTPPHRERRVRRRCARPAACGTGLEARQVGPSAWRIERRTAPRTAVGATLRRSRSSEAAAAETIVVTAPSATRRWKRPRSRFRSSSFATARNATPRGDSAWVARPIEGAGACRPGPGAQPDVPARRGRQPVQWRQPIDRGGCPRRPRLTYSRPIPTSAWSTSIGSKCSKGPQGTLYGTGALGGNLSRRHAPARSFGARSKPVPQSEPCFGRDGRPGSGDGEHAAGPDTAASRWWPMAASRRAGFDTGADADSNSAA